MTEKQIEVLRASEKGVDYYEDLDDLGREDMDYLYGAELCGCGSFKPPIYTITAKGRAELAELERAADKVRKEHSEKNSNRVFELIKSLFDAVIGAVVALAIEHHAEIFAFLKSLFHK